MKPNDRTTAGQSETISFEITLNHPPDKVWRALTDPELLAEWHLPVVGLELELELGAAFTLQAPPQQGWDGAVQCCFAEIEPNKTLRYTWVVGDLDTAVTFALTPTGSGTLLSLVQTGFKPEQKRNFGGARCGWGMMGEKLLAMPLDALILRFATGFGVKSPQGHPFGARKSSDQTAAQRDYSRIGA